MNKTTSTNKRPKLALIIGLMAIGLAGLSFILYIFVFNSNSSSSVVVVQKNKDNAEAIKQEAEKEPIVITNDTLNDGASSTSTPQKSENTQPQPTMFADGPSTKLDRSDVHAFTLKVHSIYNDFLSKLKGVPESERQGVADQYVQDNSAYFSPTFNYLESNSLHLFPQTSNVALPDSIRIYSAIVDPSDSSQVIVQVLMEPDTSMSLLVVAKKKDTLGNFGTFEKLIIRMNQNPL